MSRWDPEDDEVKDPRPYDFAGAKRAHARGSRDQASAAKWRADTAEGYAEAERAYRVALALKITELRAEGWPATVCADLARGDKNVARLRRERDISEGLKDAAEGSSWQASANRRGLEQLVAWSMRVAPDGQHDEG